jgi:hypothetical protein
MGRGLPVAKSRGGALVVIKVATFIAVDSPQRVPITVVCVRCAQSRLRWSAYAEA